MDERCMHMAVLTPENTGGYVKVPESLKRCQLEEGHAGRHTFASAWDADGKRVKVTWSSFAPLDVDVQTRDSLFPPMLYPWQNEVIQRMAEGEQVFVNIPRQYGSNAMRLQVEKFAGLTAPAGPMYDRRGPFHRDDPDRERWRGMLKTKADEEHSLFAFMAGSHLPWEWPNRISITVELFPRLSALQAKASRAIFRGRCDMSNRLEQLARRLYPGTPPWDRGDW